MASPRPNTSLTPDAFYPALRTPGAFRKMGVGNSALKVPTGDMLGSRGPETTVIRKRAPPSQSASSP